MMLTRTFASYLTTTDVQWRDVDYAAYKIVKCAKREPFNGYLEVPVQADGRLRRLRFDSSDPDQLFGAICHWMAVRLRKALPGPFSIVPIPNKSALIGQDDVFRTQDIANHIASKLGPRVTVAPILRWAEALPRSHGEGGSRDPHRLMSALRVVGDVANDCILLDDVITTGGHMAGARMRLETAGIVPRFGIAVGRSTKIQQQNPLSWKDEELPDSPVASLFE